VDRSARLQHLQALAASLPHADGAAVAPLLLLLPGVDGQSNWGSQVALKYLCLGTTGPTAAEPTISEADEALEDSILALQDGRPPTAFVPVAAAPLREVLDLAAAEPVWTLSKEEADDTEAAEVFKIKAFVELVRGKASVAVPLEGHRAMGIARSSAAASTAVADGSSPTAARDIVEQWPLVQA